MRTRGWTVEQEIADIDRRVDCCTRAIREAKAHGDHNLDECLARRDELLDFRNVLTAETEGE